MNLRAFPFFLSFSSLPSFLRQINQSNFFFPYHFISFVSVLFSFLVSLLSISHEIMKLFVPRAPNPRPIAFILYVTILKPPSIPLIFLICVLCLAAAVVAARCIGLEGLRFGMGRSGGMERERDDEVSYSVNDDVLRVEALLLLVLGLLVL